MGQPKKLTHVQRMARDRRREVDKLIAPKIETLRLIRRAFNGAPAEEALTWMNCALEVQKEIWVIKTDMLDKETVRKFELDDLRSDVDRLIENALNIAREAQAISNFTR